jgi:hypothetical protein
LLRPRDCDCQGFADPRSPIPGPDWRSAICRLPPGARSLKPGAWSPEPRAPRDGICRHLSSPCRHLSLLRRGFKTGAGGRGRTPVADGPYRGTCSRPGSDSGFARRTGPGRVLKPLPGTRDGGPAAKDEGLYGGVRTLRRNGGADLPAMCRHRTEPWRSRLRTVPRREGPALRLPRHRHAAIPGLAHTSALRALIPTAARSGTDLRWGG